MLKNFLILIVCSFLMACAPKTIYLVKTEFRLLELDRDHTQVVSIPIPPLRADYLLKTPSEQRAMLADYSLKLQTNLQQCNRQLSSIEELQFKQLETLHTKNMEPPKEKP